MIIGKTKTQPKMKHFEEFIHRIFADGGALFCGGTIFGWFGGWFLVLGDASISAWSVILKVVVVLVSAAATGLATVAGKDFWVFKIRPKIFNHKKDENGQDKRA